MKLVSAKPLVEDARRRRYAVPAFNTNSANYEMTRAALEAAQELRAADHPGIRDQRRVSRFQLPRDAGHDVDGRA